MGGQLVEQPGHGKAADIDRNRLAAAHRRNRPTPGASNRYPGL